MGAVKMKQHKKVVEATEMLQKEAHAAEATFKRFENSYDTINAEDFDQGVLNLNDLEEAVQRDRATINDQMADEKAAAMAREQMDSAVKGIEVVMDRSAAS